MNECLSGKLLCLLHMDGVAALHVIACDEHIHIPNEISNFPKSIASYCSASGSIRAAFRDLGLFFDRLSAFLASRRTCISFSSLARFFTERWKMISRTYKDNVNAWHALSDVRTDVNVCACLWNNACDSLLHRSALSFSSLLLPFVFSPTQIVSSLHALI
jgi:hypothetical protein